MATSQSDRFISPFITCPQKNKKQLHCNLSIHMGLLPLLWHLHLATLENHQESSEVIGTSLARTVWMLSDFNWKVGQYG